MNNNNLPSLNLNLYDLLYYSLIPFFGQILARINNFNNSLDQPLLLLLSIIPFGEIIPLLYIYLVGLKVGVDNNSSPIINKYILLPIIIKIYSEFLIPDKESYKLLNFILVLSSLFIININRRYVICNKITTKSLIKIIIDTAIMHSFIGIFVFFIKNILIKYIFSDLIYYNYINLVLWILGYVYINITLNIYSNLVGNDCSDREIVNINDIIPLIVLLLLYIIIIK